MGHGKPASLTRAAPRTRLRVASIPDGSQFCFTRQDDDQEVFIHRTSFAPPEVFETLRVGDTVEAVVKEMSKGLRGYNARIVARAARDGRDDHGTTQKPHAKPKPHANRDGYNQRRYYPEDRTAHTVAPDDTDVDED